MPYSTHILLTHSCLVTYDWLFPRNLLRIMTTDLMEHADAHDKPRDPTQTAHIASYAS
jgi:hypothetical protein